jgi:hypothetical protein
VVVRLHRCAPLLGVAPSQVVLVDAPVGADMVSQIGEDGEGHKFGVLLYFSMVRRAGFASI